MSLHSGLVVLLVVRQIRGSRGEHLGEEVVRKEEGSHARTPGHASQIAKGTDTNAPEDVVGKLLGRNGALLRGLHQLDLMIDLVVKVTGHRRGVDGTNVNAEILDLDVQTAGELRHKGLGRCVHGSERGGDKSRHRRREHDAALQFLLHQNLDEVMRNIDRRRRIALDIGQKLADGGLVQESGDDEASVVEDDLHVNVLGLGLDGLHVVHTRAEGNTDGTELQIGILGLQFLDGGLEEVVVERNHHDVESLRGQLEAQGLADAAAAARDQRPLRIVLLLEVRYGTEGHEQLGDEVGNEPEGGRDGHQSYRVHSVRGENHRERARFRHDAFWHRFSGCKQAHGW